MKKEEWTKANSSSQPSQIENDDSSEAHTETPDDDTWIQEFSLCLHDTHATDSGSSRPSSPSPPLYPSSTKVAEEGFKIPEKHISTIDPELLPVNWPTGVKYLIDYEYHPSISSALLDLVQGCRRRQKDRKDQQRKIISIPLAGKGMKGKEEDEEEERSQSEQEYDDIPIGYAIPGILRTTSSSSSPPLSSSLSSSSSTTTTAAAAEANISQDDPPPPYEIRLITSPPSHPVLGSYGLFATTLLRPGRHLLDYISLIVPDDHADPNSDHTLYLSNDLNLDASLHGNHGRFVNDFRGIRTYQQGPNVGWDLYRDGNTGQVRMGCKVLKRIQRGEEILCTYGKAYWKSRGVKVTGNEWEDGWDTDMEDQSDDEDDDDDDDDDDVMPAQ
ncbi:hypothetical protein EDD11_008616 [Mortierella claussenii]|nr:hypothetical protein EDD11_008616 [Mortierella claussenii]